MPSSAGQDWLQTLLDGDRMLVEHRDLDAWLRGPQLEEALRAWVTGRRALVRREADFAPLFFNKEIANDTRTNEQ